MRIWWRWLPSVLWMAFIFFMSSRTGDELKSLFPMFSSFDWGHLAAYFVLSLSFYYPLRTYFSPGRSKVVAVLCSLAYGFTDEWHQSFVPSRMPDVADLLNDFIGAAIAMFIVFIAERRNKSRCEAGSEEPATDKR